MTDGIAGPTQGAQVARQHRLCGQVMLSTQTDDPRPAVALDIHSPDRRHRSSFPRRYASVVGRAGYALVGWAATAHAGR